MKNIVFLPSCPVPSFVRSLPSTALPVSPFPLPVHHRPTNCVHLNLFNYLFIYLLLVLLFGLLVIGRFVPLVHGHGNNGNDTEPMANADSCFLSSSALNDCFFQLGSKEAVQCFALSLRCFFTAAGLVPKTRLSPRLLTMFPSFLKGNCFT